MMKHRSNKLRDAILFALAIGTTSLAGTGLALAQEVPDSTDATTLDRIQVTGSNIAIPGLTTNSPVTSIEREEIIRSQPIAAEEFLKLLPGATPAIGPGTNNGTAGAATVELRDLGAQRTLVLMDGRRIVPFDLNGVVDTNVIPVALIQSVDLVTGGASTVYGADAVAGVVNFILRRDFEGVEFSTSSGMSSKGDGNKFRADATIGANFDDGRGNVAMSIGYTKTNEVRQGDRSFGRVSLSSTTGNPQGSFTTVPSYIEAFNPDNDPAAGVFGQIDPVTGAIVEDVQTFNFNPLNFYQTPLDRYQMTALGRYDISDRVEAYAQALYTRSEVVANLAPSGIFFETLDTPIGNPFIPDAARAQLCAEFGIADCTAGNTTLIPLTIARRMTELGPRLDDYSTKTFQFTFGFRGDISDNWRYDTYYSHGESDQNSVRGNWGSLSKTRRALLAVDPNVCMDGSSDCVPLNIWGPEGSVTPEMANFINLSAYSTQSVTQDVISATTSGDLGENFKSPWADYPIGLAFGLEHRSSSARTRSDAATQTLGEVMGTGAPTPDTTGKFTLDEAYGELLLPILSSKPGAYALNLEAGYRYSEFETSSGSSTDYESYKYGLEWAPIESLRFRGMFQRATRAPNITELFLPVITGLDNLAVDPCAGTATNAAEANTPGTLSNLCRQTGVPVGRLGNLTQPSAGQANILFGGNPLLKPEIADTQTLGFVWQPSFAHDFALTLDYWKIKMEDVISEPSVDDVIEGCYNAAFNPGLTFNSYCAFIGRDPGNGSFNGSTAPGIALLTTNQGRIETDGFDLGVRYGFDLSNAWGRLDFALDATKVNSNKFQATPNSINRECVGYYSVACGIGSYDYKWNLRSVWSIQDLELALTWRHVSSLEEEPGGTDFLPAFSKIDAYDYFDLGVAYKAPFNARIQLTVNNLTDKKPPIVGNTIGTTTENSGNTFPQFYDVLGRYFTLGVTFNF